MMLLTKSQAQRFWREWAAACRYQGWTRPQMATAEIDAKRKELLARCGFRSLTEVDRTHGFDRVLKELRDLQDVVSVAGEDEGDAKRLRWKIAEAKSELRASVENVPGYVAEIIRDKFNHGRSRRVEIITEDDLTPKQLHELLITINARIKTLKEDAPHPSHPSHSQIAAPDLDPELYPF